MILFAFAVDRLPARRVRRHPADQRRARPGRGWPPLFSLLVLVQRTFAVETDDGALDALRVAGVDAGGDVLGQVAGAGAQLAVLEALLLVRARSCSTASRCGRRGRRARGHDLAARYLRPGRGRYALRRPRCRRTGAGDAAPAAVAPGGGARSDRSHTERSKQRSAPAGRRSSDGWPWVGLLAVFAVAFGAGGTLAFGPLIDE